MSAPQAEEERGQGGRKPGQERGQEGDQERDQVVVPFRRRGKPPGSAGLKDSVKQPVKGLEAYSADAGPDDYPQRMRNNLLAAVLCVALIGAGIWLANTIADLRKKQDCVLSGRRDCADVSVPGAGPK